MRRRTRNTRRKRREADGVGGHGDRTILGQRTSVQGGPCVECDGGHRHDGSRER